MNKPRIKRALPYAVRTDGRIQLGFYEFADEDGTVEWLIGALNGARSLDEVLQDLSVQFPDVDIASVRSFADQLFSLGLVEDAEGPTPLTLSRPELDRYSRGAEYFAIMDSAPRTSPFDLQARLKQSRVTVLGVGGTGSSVALSLAMSGVGELHVADFDRVELSNLNRQILFSESDVGKSKVEAAVARLQSVNSNVKVTGQELQVSSAEDIVPLMTDRDVFVLCADRPVESILTWTNQASLRTNCPWFFALSRGTYTSVGGFVPHQTACQECAALALAEGRSKAGIERSWDPNEVRAVPAITPMATLSASLCSFDVLHFLAGIDTQLLGVELNLSMHDFTKVDRHVFSRRSDCSACGTSVSANKAA